MNKYKQYIQHWFIQCLAIFFCICYLFILHLTRTSITSTNTANITPAPQFSDIAPQTYDAIVTNYLYQKGIITGYEDGTFGLQKTINRIEATAMLVRSIKKEPKSTTYEKFIDTDISAWYATSLQTAKEQGVIQGYADGTFKPENNVSRSEFIKMLSKSWGLPEYTAHTFTDVETNSYYEPFVGWYEKQGIFFAPLLLPSKPITRQEVARALYAAIMLQPKITIAPTTNPIEDNSTITNRENTQGVNLHPSADDTYSIISNIQTSSNENYAESANRNNTYTNMPDTYLNNPNTTTSLPYLTHESTNRNIANSTNNEGPNQESYSRPKVESTDTTINMNNNGAHQEEYSEPNVENTINTIPNQNTQTDIQVNTETITADEFIQSDEIQERPIESDESIFSLLYFDDSKFFP